MSQVGAAGWIALLFGLFLGGSAAIELLKYTGFRRRAQRTSGVVVGFRTSTSRGGGPRPKTMYHPILEFTTQDGRHVKSSPKAGTNPPIARDGDRVTVVYDPREPDQVEVGGKGWIRPTLLVVGAVLGFFFVVVFFVGVAS